MAEHDQRSTVTKLLKKWDAVAVENPVHPGTPDVNCILGWIELKWLRAWPVRADTVVKIEHFTRQQRVWSPIFLATPVPVHKVIPLTCQPPGEQTMRQQVE